MAERKELSAPRLYRRDAQLSQRGSREFRPQETELLEFLFGAAFDEQREKIAHPATLKLRIRVLHDGGNVIHGKGGVLFREATLHPTNQRPLLLRHPDIVAAIPVLVKAFRITSY